MERVLARFGLGPPVAGPVRVAGGLSNELWRVQTARGVFAVKRMVVNAGRPGFAGAVEAAFAVERRAWRAGVPMPEPVAVAGRALAEVDGSLFRVHHWVPGRPGVGSAREAAVLAAGIHAAGRARWEEVSAPPWLGDGRDAAVAGLARRVARRPGRLLVVDSHGDLDRKNTLRTGGGVLMALDWDAAGPVSAVQEAVSVALDWSDGEVGVFADALRAYTESSGLVLPAQPWVFGGWVDAQGGWLDHTAVQDPGEAGRTLARMRRLAAGLEELVAALPSPPG